MGTAIYARISQDRQDDHQATDRQLEDCRHRVKGPVPEFVDNGVSAWKRGGSRPEYARLLEQVRSGAVNKIVVWHVDRLYRQMRELLDLIDIARAGNRVTIEAVTGPSLDLSTSDGVMWAQWMVMAAEHESSHKGERVERAQQQKREQGLSTGGRRAFGWKDSMTPDPQEVKEILMAVEALEAGASLRDVARGWNKRGVQRTQKEGLWSAGQVRLVLSNPRHAGLLAHDRERISTYERTIIGEAKWPAILPRERWEALMELLQSRSRATTGIPKRRSLLTRILYCGVCGAVMVRSKDHSSYFYRCHPDQPAVDLKPGFEQPCGRVSISQTMIEEFLAEATLLRADTGALAGLLREQAREQTSAVRLVAKLEELERRADTVGAKFGRGKLSERALQAALRELEAEQAQVRKQLAEVTHSNLLTPYAGRPGALRAAWGSLTEDQRREIIGAVLGRIEIDPTAVRGRHRFDPNRVRVANGG